MRLNAGVRIFSPLKIVKLYSSILVFRLPRLASTSTPGTIHIDTAVLGTPDVFRGTVKPIQQYTNGCLIGTNNNGAGP